jgi:hypothetical protein
MKNLEYSEKILLKTIIEILAISRIDLSDIYLRIKTNNRATESDFKALFILEIPIYQAIFPITDRFIKDDNSDAHFLKFSDFKYIMHSLVEPNGLLYHYIDNTPRFHFSIKESTDIKILLKQAKGMNRKGRQDILSTLRIKFKFFPSAITKSRARFDDETFDHYVLKGKITLS